MKFIVIWTKNCLYDQFIIFQILMITFDKDRIDIYVNFNLIKKLTTDYSNGFFGKRLNCLVLVCVFFLCAVL